ncbi:capsid scaffolding [Escherichia coli]|nr:GPO family capsid scaffolding protein [Escherichia coli]STI08130.1 capsid scaffolding [Escherichia coli]
MTVKAKRFRIGVEGATTDGREIQREWLEQMAASYNPAVYTALINLEHIKSYLPDSTFNRYGKVTALFAEEIMEGPLAGKMALYADVEPTESLVELVKKGQKLFTSMEVSPKFADTGKAYLVGLAATDDPASLGTEMLTFSASAAHNPLANRKQNPANLFTAAEETVIELEEIQDDKPSLFARVTALFTKKEQSDDARFSDVHKAVELVATEQQNLSARTEKSLSEQEERLSELETALQAQQLQYQRSWRHAANSRVNRRPSTQFLGPENDMLTLSGVLMPEITGGRLSLLALEQMAEQGKAWPLIEGSGTIYGMYVIEGLNQTKTEFFRDGMPRRIEFTLSLKRVDESLSDMFGDLSAQLNNLQDTATSALSDISKTVGGLLS